MRMKFLKFVFAFVLILMLFGLIPNKSNAITSLGGYTVENYDIDVVVNEDNTFDITENIKVFFNEERHRNI